MDPMAVFAAMIWAPSGRGRHASCLGLMLDGSTQPLVFVWTTIFSGWGGRAPGQFSLPGLRGDWGRRP